MSLLRRNIVANVLGQSVGVLSGIVLMPLYARFLGEEGFGLVGFFLSMQGIAAILDLGLAAAANREVSRRSTAEGSAGSGRDVVRTLEFVYLAMATLAFVTLASSAGWVAVHWVKAEQLSPALIRDCLVIAAATIALRLVGALFHGVLRGLERQVTLNLFASAMIMVQTMGLASILFFMRPSLHDFFLFQLAFAALEIALLRHLVWRELRTLGTARAGFKLAVLGEIWRYALSVNGISLFAAGIKQVDKIVISSLLSIGSLGYYSAASLAANGLGKVAVPFQTALFPHFAKLHARQQHEELGRLFRDTVKLLSLLTSAVAAAFVFFSHDVLWIWMRSSEAAAAGSAPLSILAAAMMLNGAMAPVFILILATGYTQISLAMNAVGFVLLVPATIYLVGRFGLPGAAMAWFGFNAAYYAIVPVWLARKWPQMSLRAFYLEDSAPYLMTSVVIFGLFSRLSAGIGSYGRLGVAALAGSCCLGAGLLATPSLRQMAFALRTRRQ